MLTGASAQNPGAFATGLTGEVCRRGVTKPSWSFATGTLFPRHDATEKDVKNVCWQR
jgi:hypothetical protein